MYITLGSVDDVEILQHTLITHTGIRVCWSIHDMRGRPEAGKLD